MKVMLAPRETPSPDQLRFPVLASPKLDGVRAVVVGGVVLSRNGKPIPNKSIQARFGKAWMEGFDGELIVGDPTAPNCFQATMSGVMSVEGSPLATFYAFDHAPTNLALQVPKALSAHPYELRMLRVRKFIDAKKPKGLVAVQQTPIVSAAGLEQYEAEAVEAGYEGVMLRDPMGPYKMGRCTLKEGTLLKVKRFADSEAVVLGYEEEQANTNEAKRNAAGRLERSSAKAGKVGKGVLGALQVRDVETGAEFSIGTGFTHAQRADLWAVRNSLAGQVITYRYFPHGMVDAPRFPVFKGFRHPIDA